MKMIQAISSINNNQNYVNFEGRGKKLSAKRIKKGINELPYTLGLKKKKTFWERLKGIFVKEKTFGEKVSDFFSKKTKPSQKKGKNVLTETEPKKDGLFTVLAKDLAERVKKTNEILNS